MPTLEDLGFDASFAEVLEAYRETHDGDFFVARVAIEHKELYIVRDGAREYAATVTGTQMFEAKTRADYPAVGDFVVIEKVSDDKAVIHHILPRKTTLERKYSNKDEVQIIATNVDCVFVVEAVGRDYNLNRFERYFVIAREGGVVPVVVLNKVDLISEEELEEIKAEVEERFGDVAVITTSTVAETGINALRDYIEAGKTYSFLGSSGVGKSSLINALLGNGEIEVQEISEQTQRGKHTTTTREMYLLEGGGVVIDNPGTRGVGVVESKQGIEDVFSDMEELARECKFSDCSHTNEPGCAVLAALKDGELDEDRHQNYLRLSKENEFYEMGKPEKRAKDRKFGKYVKKVMEDKHRHSDEF